ncbi:hypothetical protein ACEN8I_20045 [Polaromonas sp. CT11-55]|uniref:DUF805 domain-containing protein n=1 Tax=Polaromonas sp. CT11-55 TaxID=3243045 RepID=UPI0039A6DB17
MNPSTTGNKSKISRLAFLLRFVLAYAALSVLWITANVSQILAARDNAYLALFLVLVLVMLILLLPTVYFFFSRAILPRLRDIGLYGPFCTGIALLWFVPPLNPLLILALLLVPGNFIPGEYAEP